MIKKWSDIRGETLAETIIALSVLAMGITIASTVVLNSMRNMAAAKQRVVAVNIAREGIEAVRGIRDTNWLLYSDRRRQCWNHDPGAAVPCSDGANPIVPGVYVVYKHAPEGSWRLAFADTDRNVDTNGDSIVDNDVDADLAKLSLVDIDVDTDSDGDTFADNDMDMYNHKNAGIPNTFGVEVENTPFSRYLIIEYLENQPNAATPPSNIAAPLESINTLTEWMAFGDTTLLIGDTTLLNRMRITSVVEWRRTGAVHSVKLKTVITDHLGREDLGS